MQWFPLDVILPVPQRHQVSRKGVQFAAALVSRHVLLTLLLEEFRTSQWLGGQFRRGTCHLLTTFNTSQRVSLPFLPFDSEDDVHI